jgi:hypothetical protein
MNTTPQLLDVVALLAEVPAYGLLRGQVGTVVDLLDGAWEVEFSDNGGKTYAELALQSDQLLVLHHRPQHSVLTNGRADPRRTPQASYHQRHRSGRLARISISRRQAGDTRGDKKGPATILDAGPSSTLAAEINLGVGPSQGLEDQRPLRAEPSRFANVHRARSPCASDRP